MDEAKAILEQTASQDPSNAMEQYELARVHYHMALGNPQKMEGMFKESQACIEKAIGVASENVIYHTFAGHVAFMRGYFYRQVELFPLLHAGRPARHDKTIRGEAVALGALT